ncbi:glutamine--fructose-6-phosphate transaminase (isomerizing) [Methylocella sp.]|uniref:glutamine--fructose-6-phosphate transaminase (isomerizing) n=1 Tax=Methylocella sp. TaxID=1978226 RepID=UPI003783207D
MCGIVGALALGPAQPILVEGLKRLEYRGYDSAGLATLEHGAIERRRASGKLRNLEALLAERPLKGTTGVGHTRWATHGKATEANAHPHATDRVAVVHNGIIENFRELREELKAQGHVFASQTDSEVIAHLASQGLDEGLDPTAATLAAVARLEGAFAFVLLFAGENDLLIGASRGAPLAVGFGEDDREGEMFLGSDALALAPFTQTIAYLEDGDVVVVSRAAAVFMDSFGRPVTRRRVRTLASAYLVDKGGYRHFMSKEIHEQPEVVARTLAHYLDMATGQIEPPHELPVDVARLSRITLCGCGTAYYSALVAKYWFERFARLPVEVEIASEFRYRDPPLEEGGLFVVVSQSGETADTLAALRLARAKGQKILSIVNVQTSTIARESDVVAATLAGPEIGVASTKAFTCQLAVFAALAIAFGVARGTLAGEAERAALAELIAVPGLMAQALKCEPVAESAAHKIARARDALYLGRGTAYPLALEGALKLKEITYIHAEGYAAGELKHGPIALIDADLPVIVLAPNDGVLDKTVSNVQEVAARGGRLILIGEEEIAREAAVGAEAVVAMPKCGANFAAMIYAVPIQLIAYYTAVELGKDADQPRNLAKSVTVE